MPARSGPRRAVRGASWNDVLYASVSPTYQQFDLWLPTTNTPTLAEPPYPLVIFIHGGGWNSGTKDIASTHFAHAVRSLGMALASIDYRPSTVGAWPVQIQDVKAAIRFLRANASRFHLDPARIGLWGYSAGAHLALLAAVSPGVGVLTDGALGNAGVSEAVSCAAMLAAPSDFPTEDAALVTNGFSARVCGTTSEEAQLLGGASTPTNPCAGAGLTLATQASPLTYLGAGTPPLRLEHGDQDVTVPYQQSAAFHAQCQAKGVASTYFLHAGQTHGLNLNTTITNATAAWFKTQLVS